MDKKELRSRIRAQKRAMSEAEIAQKSERLGQLFASSSLYRRKPFMAIFPTIRRFELFPCWNVP